MRRYLWCWRGLRCGAWASSAAQGLANTAWAHARAVQSDVLLLRMLARVTERRVGDISAQEPANTAWVYAKGQQSDAPLFVVLVMVAERRGGDFSAQVLAKKAEQVALLNLSAVGSALTRGAVAKPHGVTLPHRSSRHGRRSRPFLLMK